MGDNSKLITRIKIAMLIIIIILVIFILVCFVKIINSNNYNLKVISKTSNSIKFNTASIYEYNIYYYGIKSMNVLYKNKEINLKEAIEKGKININKIIEKAEDDEKKDKIETYAYSDGSKLYKYDDYAIIKRNTADGNKDVYIGIPKMRLKDVY